MSGLTGSLGRSGAAPAGGTVRTPGDGVASANRAWLHHHRADPRRLYCLPVTPLIHRWAARPKRRVNLAQPVWAWPPLMTAAERQAGAGERCRTTGRDPRTAGRRPDACAPGHGHQLSAAAVHVRYLRLGRAVRRATAPGLSCRPPAPPSGSSPPTSTSRSSTAGRRTISSRCRSRWRPAHSASHAAATARPSGPTPPLTPASTPSSTRCSTPAGASPAARTRHGGLMSSTGVPSMASSRTSTTPGRTAISSQTHVPIRFGRSLCWARMPTIGHSGLPGWRPRHTPADPPGRTRTPPYGRSRAACRYAASTISPAGSCC